MEKDAVPSVIGQRRRDHAQIPAFCRPMTGGLPYATRSQSAHHQPIIGPLSNLPQSSLNLKVYCQSIPNTVLGTQTRTFHLHIRSCRCKKHVGWLIQEKKRILPGQGQK
ncbi:hypothetical protein DICVIV_13350 [Dictyocaulus viviparus]|uniref:Uncharacterized protein n=1 Tax=Dictyocaulus viviparus TaxID=29172 RepID=A0A0D8XE53_DICVI|nr:hypothetical protein DICVIV_13350 [Dictyocaulus viviparus]